MTSTPAEMTRLKDRLTPHNQPPNNRTATRVLTPSWRRRSALVQSAPSRVTRPGGRWEFTISWEDFQKYYAETSLGPSGEKHPQTRHNINAATTLTMADRRMHP